MDAGAISRKDGLRDGSPRILSTAINEDDNTGTASPRTNFSIVCWLIFVNLSILRMPIARMLSVAGELLFRP
jgi:hypothetical protein